MMSPKNAPIEPHIQIGIISMEPRLIIAPIPKRIMMPGISMPMNNKDSTSDMTKTQKPAQPGLAVNQFSKSCVQLESICVQFTLWFVRKWL